MKGKYENKVNMFRDFYTVRELSLLPLWDL